MVPAFALQKSSAMIRCLGPPSREPDGQKDIYSVYDAYKMTRCPEWREGRRVMRGVVLWVQVVHCSRISMLHTLYTQ